MRLAILGDIHANSKALEVVLRAAEKHGINRFLVAGDTVGYNLDPAGVLNLLNDRNVHYVRGNHEDSLRLVHQIPSAINIFDPKHRPPLEAALKLPEHLIEWITGLPHPLYLEFGCRKILLSHGTPWEVGFYLYENEHPELFERMSKMGMDLIVMGHTHYQYTKRIGETLFINPGSVGQPRGGQTGAYWAIYDTHTGQPILCREQL